MTDVFEFEVINKPHEKESREVAASKFDSELNTDETIAREKALTSAIEIETELKEKISI